MDHPAEEQFEISYFRTMWATFASIGWYIIAAAICVCYASPYVREKYASWKLRKDEQDYAAKYHKNSDLLQERLSALEASRQRMQEEYYQKCMVVQQEGKEKEKKKRASILVDANLVGHRLGSNTSDQSTFTEKKSKSLRGEYNPLMGDSSRGYRPPKRNCCSKGSCG